MGEGRARGWPAWAPHGLGTNHCCATWSPTPYGLCPTMALGPGHLHRPAHPLPDALRFKTAHFQTKLPKLGGFPNYISHHALVPQAGPGEAGARRPMGAADGGRWAPRRGGPPAGSAGISDGAAAAVAAGPGRGGGTGGRLGSGGPRGPFFILFFSWGRRFGLVGAASGGGAWPRPFPQVLGAQQRRAGAEARRGGPGVQASRSPARGCSRVILRCCCCQKAAAAFSGGVNCWVNSQGYPPAGGVPDEFQRW